MRTRHLLPSMPLPRMRKFHEWTLALLLVAMLWSPLTQNCVWATTPAELENILLAKSDTITSGWKVSKNPHSDIASRVHVLSRILSLARLEGRESEKSDEGRRLKSEFASCLTGAVSSERSSTIFRLTNEKPKENIMLDMAVWELETAAQAQRLLKTVDGLFQLAIIEVDKVSKHHQKIYQAMLQGFADQAGKPTRCSMDCDYYSKEGPSSTEQSFLIERIDLGDEAIRAVFTPKFTHVRSRCKRGIFLGADVTGQSTGDLVIITLIRSGRRVLIVEASSDGHSCRTVEKVNEWKDGRCVRHETVIVNGPVFPMADITAMIDAAADKLEGKITESRADLQISRKDIRLSWGAPNGFMEIETSADEQCVTVEVKNLHPTATARNVLIQLSAGPTLGDGVPIGNPVPAGDLAPGKNKIIATKWDLNGQNIEGVRLYAHAYCPDSEDANPGDNFAFIDIEGIYYAHNGTRAFSFAHDTFSFKNYGLKDLGIIARVVDKQAAWVAGCLDKKAPKHTLIIDPLRMVLYERHQKYMDKFNEIGIGGQCHGFVHAAKDFFETPTSRPIAKELSALTRGEVGPTLSIYQTTQMLRFLPSVLTNTWFNKKDYDISRTLSQAEDSLKVKRQCIAIFIAGFVENRKGEKEKESGWGHVVLGFKLIKVKGRATILYVYDPNLPYASPKIQNQRCMTQIVFAEKTWGLSENMSAIYHQTAYNSQNTRVRVYSWGLAKQSMRELSQAEVKSASKIARNAVYTMGNLMQATGITGIMLRCPADAHFIDADGFRTGMVGGVVVNEIPGAEVCATDDVEIYFLPDHRQYQIVVEGTADGQARLASVRGESETRIAVTAYDGIPLRAGSRAVGVLAPGGHITSLVTDATNLSAHLDGFLDQDDPVWIVPAGDPSAPFEQALALLCAPDKEFIRSLYHAITHREPTVQEIEAQVGLLQSGTPRKNMVQYFFASPGYVNQNHDSVRFITDACQAIYGRQPTEAELKSWPRTQRSVIIAEMFKSREHLNLTDGCATLWR